MTRAGGLSPNWSCIGIGSGGSGGSGGTGSGQNVFRVEDFQNGDGVADLEVALYAGNSIIGQTPFHTGFTKGPLHPGPAQLAVGELLYSHPGTPTLSYHVLGSPGVAMDFYGFGLDALPAPATVVGLTMSPTLFEQLANFAVPLVGWTLPDDLAMVTGPVRDCDGNDVGGARVKLIDVATNQDVVPGTCERDLRYIYFDSSYPNPKCQYSEASNARFLLVNAEANASGPKAGQAFRIELWGRLQASDASPVKFAERSVDLFPGVMNVHVIPPNVTQ
jgi:hypothetical protein